MGLILCQASMAESTRRRPMAYDSGPVTWTHSPSGERSAPAMAWVLPLTLLWCRLLLMAWNSQPNLSSAKLPPPPPRTS